MRRIIAIVSGSLIVAMLLAATAFAAEVSRDEYKEAAEPICKSSVKANEGILAGVEQQVKADKLMPAAAAFAKASKEQTQVLRELERLPRPQADEARLTKWFAYLKIEAELFAMAGKKLKAGDKAGATQVFRKLTNNVNKANLQVLPFSFDYCRLDASKLT